MAEYSGRDKRLQYLFDAVENVQVDDMTGASASTDGAHGLVPAPLAGDEDKYLKGDGSWAAVQAGAGALSGLSDVDLSSPTDGQALVYDGTNSKWINGNVSGGGGGSARYKEVVLWENANGLEFYPRSIQTVALSQSILDFDIIVIEVSTKSAPLYRGTSVTPVSTIDKTGTNNFGNTVIVNTVYCTPSMYYVDYTHIKFSGASSSTADHMMVYKVLGIKWETMQTALIYSTEEREVGVWTDGKPLYQKTIIVNNPTNNTDLEYDLGVTDLDEVISQEGTWDRDMGSGGIWTYDLNATNERAFTNSYIVIARIRNGTKKLYVYVGTTYPDVPCIRFTFRYTKTTDTAGSGTWTTTGEYAHHYSTSEKVIGTWTDGKPLYERVFTGLSVQLNSVNWVNLVAITDVKFCQDVELYRVIDATTQRRAKLPLAECDANNGYIRVSTISSTFNDVVETAIVRYTKTTD